MLYLTVGVLVLIAAGWVFGGIAQDVAAGDPLTVVELRVGRWLHDRATPLLTAFCRGISGLASGWTVTGISLATAA